MAEENVQAELISTYETAGFKQLEKWLNDQIGNCLAEIMSVETPSETVEKVRMIAAAYQSILDKVSADKQMYKQSQQA